MWITLAVSVVSASVTAFFTARHQEAAFLREFIADSDQVRTRFMAEVVAKELLSSEDWTKRSFEAIKRRLGGFDDQELRKILVRSGAVRFEGEGDEELWGLLARNRNAL